MKPIEFEKRFGSIALIKTILSTMNDILVSKGITTEKCLQDLFEFKSALYITTETSKLIHGLKQPKTPKRSRNTKPTLHPVKKKGKKNPKVKAGSQSVNVEPYELLDIEKPW